MARGCRSFRCGRNPARLLLRSLHLDNSWPSYYASCLTIAGRYGKMIALEFSSSSGAQALEQTFKTIDLGSKNTWLWEQVPKNLPLPAFTYGSTPPL